MASRSTKKSVHAFVQREGQKVDKEERAAIRERLRNLQTTVELRKQLRAAEQELDLERSAREMLLALDEQSGTRHIVNKRKGKGGKNSAVTVSCLSDVHADELVEPDEVNFRNEHTPEICEEKLHRYAQGVVKLVEKEQSFHDVQTHVQWMGGDFLTGHIHDELVEATAMSPLEAILWLYPRLKAVLQYEAENLNVREIVVPWSFGNHGRDGKKPRISKAAQHNFEYLMACMMRDEVSKEPWGKKIKMIIEPGYLTYLPLECSDGGEFTIAFHHGDGLRYGGGVGGLTIPLNKAVDAWNKHRYADLYVAGHYHQVFDAAHFVQNGSLIGMGQFSIRIKAAPEPPQQAFFVIDTDRRQKVSFSLIHVLPKEELARLGWL